MELYHHSGLHLSGRVWPPSPPGALQLVGEEGGGGGGGGEPVVLPARGSDLRAAEPDDL